MSTIRELADYYVARLASQYRLQTKAPAHVGLFAKQMLADALAMEISPAFNIDTAAGEQLDIIGKYVGVDRDVQVADTRPYFGFVTADYPTEPQNPNGFVIAASLTINANGVWYETEFTNQSVSQLSDYQYRQLIKIKIATNSSDNTMASLQALIATFFDGQLQVRDNKDMTMAYFYGLAIQLPLSVLQTYLPRPMGVGITVDRNISFDVTLNAVPAFNSETPSPLIDFGSIGTPVTKAMVITNAYSVPFTITAIELHGGAFGVSGITPALPVTLNQGDSISLAVSGNPITSGPLSGSLMLTITSAKGTEYFGIDLAMVSTISPYAPGLASDNFDNYPDGPLPTPSGGFNWDSSGESYQMAIVSVDNFDNYPDGPLPAPNLGSGWSSDGKTA